MASSSQQSDSSDSDESLDPLSPHFDPRKALYAKSLKLPVPGAKQFNNLAEFENFIEGRDAKTLNKEKQNRPQLPGIIARRAAEQAQEAVRKAAIMAKSQGPSERTQTQMRRLQCSTVFTKMEGCDKGPMSLLKRCMEQRFRVVVVVRAAVSVKSRCRGYLVAFDKHFNLALMDVDETFLKPVIKEKKPNAERKQHIQTVDILSSETEKLQCCSDEDKKKQRGSKKTIHSGIKRTAVSSNGGNSLKQKTSSTTNRTVPSSFQRESKQIKERKQGTSMCSSFWTAYKPWAENRSYTTYELVERHINQLFLRGDNVVSVIVDQT